MEALVTSVPSCPGQPVGHQVRDEHDVPGPVQVAFDHGWNTVLNACTATAGRLEQACRVRLGHGGEYRLGAGIPVAGRIGDQSPVAVEQPVSTPQPSTDTASRGPSARRPAVRHRSRRTAHGRPSAARRRPASAGRGSGGPPGG